MSSDTNADQPKRVRLSRQRVINAGVGLADEAGIDSLTMRALARRLGSEPMSLYHHIANKDDLLDGMVDTVFAEIDISGNGVDWRDITRQRARSTRKVLALHPWAISVLDSRTSPGPATLRHHEAVIASLRSRGFTVAATAHALALISSYVYGFALQSIALPFDTGDEAAAVTGDILEQMPTDQYPHLTEMALEHVLRPGYDFGDEFDFGLDLILDGLDQLRTSDRS